MTAVRRVSGATFEHLTFCLTHCSSSGIFVVEYDNLKILQNMQCGILFFKQTFLQDILFNICISIHICFTISLLFMLNGDWR